MAGLSLAQAQGLPDHPVGAHYETSLPTSKGYRVPLPPGRWTVIDSYLFEQPTNKQAHVVLHNPSDQAPLPFMVVRYATQAYGTRWDDMCTTRAFQPFLVHSDAFGTQPSHNLLKCQVVLVGGFQKDTHPYYRRGVEAVINKAPEMEGRPVVQMHMQVSEVGSLWVRVELLARPNTSGITPGALRGFVFRGDHNAWIEPFKKWGVSYVEDLADAALNKKNRVLAAFQPPTLVLGPTAADVALAATAAPVLPSPTAEVDDQIRLMSGNRDGVPADSEMTARIRDAVNPTATNRPPVVTRRDDEVADRIRQMAPRRDSEADGRDAAARILQATATPVAPAASIAAPIAVPPTASPAAPPAVPVAAADNRAADAARLREEQERVRVAQAALAQERERQRLLEEARARDLAEKERLAAEARQKEGQARQAQAELARERERQRLLEEARARDQSEKERLAAEVAKLREELGRRTEPVAQPVMAHRKALIIGNDTYKHVAPLKAAREDARAMAEGLRRVGYAVTLRLDLSEREMKAAIRNFVAQIEGGDEVAFFFAGHGVQIGSANYLIPVDINGEGEAQIRDEAIALQRILDDVSDKKAKFTLAVIDACRDNPFKVAGRSIGSSSRGLAPTTAATGQMVIFSAGAGQRALDNLGDKDTSKNGVFTRVFLREMLKPSVTVDKIVRDTRNEVVRLAKSVGHDQVPAIYDQVVGEFYFLK